MDSPDEKIARLSAELSALQELIGVLEEVTFEQTKRLKESEARQHAILEAAPDCILTLDDTTQIVSANGVLNTLFGYTVEDLRERGLQILFADDEASATFEHLIADALATDGETRSAEVSTLELPGVSASGESVPLSVSVRAVRASDRAFVTAFLRDVTELKCVDAMKSEFISTVSHELRTPLASVVGSIRLLLGGIATDLPREAKQLLELADRNGQRLSLLVNDILDFEKLEAGALAFDLEVVNLEELTTAVLRDNEVYADKFEVVLETDFSDGVPNVRIDAARYAQVLTNLLSNAIKFSPRGGKVTTRIARQASLARVSVTDAGPGIPDEFRGRIFGRFAQGDSSDARRSGGTGLGLSIAKSMVERMGGRISFETEIGRGTTFHVDFNCVDAPPPAPNAAEGPRRPTRPCPSKGGRVGSSSARTIRESRPRSSARSSGLATRWMWPAARRRRSSSSRRGAATQR